MDGKRFDDLSRLMATRHSRRRIVGLLGAVASTLLIKQPANADPREDKPSKCYGGGSSCTNGKQCCSGTCINRRCAAEVITPECSSPGDCPGSDTECRARSCNGGVCGFADRPFGEPTTQQTAGDCRQNVCDGLGGITSVPDDTDLPSDTNTSDCTTPTCIGGAPSTTILPPRTVCGADGDMVCDANGHCGTCFPGDQIRCYAGPEGTANVGICVSGLQTCLSDGSGYGPCEGEVLPAVEECNGLDDDCDGVKDNGALCTQGQACCNGSCTGLHSLDNCSACGDACDPTTDTCSGLGSGADPASGCCARIGSVCDPTALDRCCNQSTCTGTNSNGQTVCCGVSGVSFCSIDSQCCSGLCGSNSICMG